MPEKVYKARKKNKIQFYLRDVGDHRTIITESVARFLQNSGHPVVDTSMVLNIPVGVFDSIELQKLSDAVHGELLELGDPQGQYKDASSNMIAKTVQTYEDLLEKIDELKNMVRIK